MIEAGGAMTKRKGIVVRLSAFEGAGKPVPRADGPVMEFHVLKTLRKEHKLDETLFSISGNVIFPNFYAARTLARSLNERPSAKAHPEHSVKAGRLNALGLVDEILHYVCGQFRQSVAPDAFVRALAGLESSLGAEETDALLLAFTEDFPPRDVYKGKTTAPDWLGGRTDGVSNRVLALEELLLLKLANDNPAFEPFRELFDDSVLRTSTAYLKALENVEAFFDGLPVFGPEQRTLVKLLRSPVEAAPYSLPGQLDYMRRNWGLLLGPLLARILGGLDMIKEEEKPFFPGPGPSRVYVYEGLEHEYERFSEDKDWMPRVVMIAKSALVWLHQLSTAYGRTIRPAGPDTGRGTGRPRVPGLQRPLAHRPLGALRRQPPHQAALRQSRSGRQRLLPLRLRDSRGTGRLVRPGQSAQSAAPGGEYAWPRTWCPTTRAWTPRGSGIDPTSSSSRITRPSRATPSTAKTSPGTPRVGIWLEDHYYSRSDAAVVFKRIDFGSGDTRYIYHGNDGTSMPWNDTAQIDFLKPEAREAVTERILHVARPFPSSASTPP